MSFVIYAKMAREILPASPQHQRWGLTRRLRRAVGMPLVPVAYLGALIAFPYVIGLIFLFLTTAAGRLDPEAYWLVAGIFTAGVLWLIWQVCRFVIRQLREGIVDIDTIAVLIGLALSLLVLAWAVSTRAIGPGPNKARQPTAARLSPSIGLGDMSVIIPVRARVSGGGGCSLRSTRHA